MSANNLKEIKNTAFKKLEAVFSSCFHYIHKKSFWGLFKNIDVKFLKFIFVGILNTCFSYFLYAFFIFMGLVPNIALYFQYILGIIWNFKTTGTIVFKNSNNKLFLKFLLSYVFTFLVNSVLLYLLTGFLNDYLSQALLILPVALLSFVIMKYWVFK